MHLVAIAQRRARHLATPSHVVKLPTHGSKARFDVAQTFAISQLTKKTSPVPGPNKKGLSTGNPRFVARHALLEFLAGQILDQLRKNSAANIHPRLFRSNNDSSPQTREFALLEFQIVPVTNRRIP
jgi:hypothetical protein